MNIKQHFINMANYNRRMNQQVYQAAQSLDKREIEEDRGAFFGSISGTLNHILVGDLLWLMRFATLSENYHSLTELPGLPRSFSLSVKLFPTFAELLSAREKVDSIIIHWLTHEVVESDFALCLGNGLRGGKRAGKNFGELVSHLFNHQTHHRGQVSTLLNQQSIDIGITDYLIEIPG